MKTTKTIFHSDYWVEIPAGEYFVGLSVEQRQVISDHIFDRVGYKHLTPGEQVWNLQAGYFYTGQQKESHGDYRVDEFPHGLSPYGVWGMVGGIPEVVEARKNKPGANEYYYTSKGCHSKESSEEMAWFDHILVLPGKGDWVSLHPVLDKWPKQQWSGFSSPENLP